jgi:hypothetical protein
VGAEHHHNLDNLIDVKRRKHHGYGKEKQIHLVVDTEILPVVIIDGGKGIIGKQRRYDETGHPNEDTVIQTRS